MRPITMNDIDLEKSVLAAMMFEPEGVMDGLQELTTEDFFAESHTHIFEAIRKLASDSKPVDFITVASELEAMGRLKDCGGQDGVSDLAARAVTAVNVAQHCRILREMSMRRRLAKVGQLAWEKASNPEVPLIEALGTLETELFRLSENRSKKTLVPVKSLLSATFEKIHSYCKKEVVGIASGLKGLDEIMTGWQKTDLTILAGRPSQGKTVFGMQFASYPALKLGAKVAFFELEMSADQLLVRALCAEAGVDMQALRKGILPEREISRLSTAVRPFRDAYFHIDDYAGNSPMQIWAKCRRMKQKMGLDLVVVDYLGLLQPDGKYSSRNEEVGANARALKFMAKELEVPVICLCQMNRSIEQRSGAPKLSDLRESGEIEQHADNVIFIHRVHNKATKDKPEEKYTELIVEKQRNGPTGAAKFTFVGEEQRFADYADPSRYPTPPTSYRGGFLDD